MKGKKIIFVAGLSYSGTTLMGSIIARQKNAVSLGEVHAFFSPSRMGHFNLTNIPKNLIPFFKMNNPLDFYDNIFSNTAYNTIVDESKSPFWIRANINRLKDKYECIILWVAKEENILKSSYERRGLDFKLFENKYGQKMNALFSTSQILKVKYPDDFYNLDKVFYKIDIPRTSLDVFVDSDWVSFGNSNTVTSVAKPLNISLLDLPEKKDDASFTFEVETRTTFLLRFIIYCIKIRFFNFILGIRLRLSK